MWNGHTESQGGRYPLALILAALMSSALPRRVGPIHLTPTVVPVPTSTPISILWPTETPQPITCWAAHTSGNEVVGLPREGIRLWPATQGGAVCWGVCRRTHRKYTTLDGLASNNLQAVAVDKEGNTWFGTCKAEVTRLSPGNVHRTVYRLNEGLGGRVQAVAMDSQGNVRFGTDGGVSVLTRGGIRTNTSHG